MRPEGDADGTTFWWRDDDAGRPHPHLDRLLELAARLELPLALAVVPAWLEPPVERLIARHANVTILQHGWAHTDHAGPGQRPIELGGRIVLEQTAVELRLGMTRLRECLGHAFQPVMVPPWNRLEGWVEALLPELGYVAVSTLYNLEVDDRDLGMRHCDVDVDAMRWGPPPLWRGIDVVHQELVAAAARRPARPVGLMTHHQAMRAGDFVELERLLVTMQASGARFAAMPELLAAG